MEEHQLGHGAQIYQSVDSVFANPPENLKCTQRSPNKNHDLLSTNDIKGRTKF